MLCGSSLNREAHCLMPHCSEDPKMQQQWLCGVKSLNDALRFLLSSLALDKQQLLSMSAVFRWYLPLRGTCSSILLFSLLEYQFSIFATCKIPFRLTVEQLWSQLVSHSMESLKTIILSCLSFCSSMLQLFLQLKVLMSDHCCLGKYDGYCSRGGKILPREPAFTTS